MNHIIDNYNKLREQMQAICLENQINHPISLVVVSKTFPIEDILTLHLNTNHLAFGENYVQEFYTKSQALIQYPLQWHFIGNIQSNKIKNIAQFAHWVHSLSSISHALKLNKERDKTLPKLNVLIEVNISHDPNKHGADNFEEITNLAKVISSQENLLLRGLMGMSGNTANRQTKDQQFKDLKEMFELLKSSGFPNIDTLSMGMSDDFDLAIKNGANMLRIGSRVFGPRN